MKEEDTKKIEFKSVEDYMELECGGKEEELYSAGSNSDDGEGDWEDYEASDQRQVAASIEHIAFGEDAFGEILQKYAKLFSLLERHGLYKSKTRQFHLQNGVELTFGQIVALAGDFFGLPKKPISSGANDLEKKIRFMKAYATLAYASDIEDEIKEIVRAVTEEAQLIMNRAAEAKKVGAEHPISVAMKDLEPIQTEKYVEATKVGGHKGNWWNLLNRIRNTSKLKYLNSRYFKLLQTNFDHFVPQAHEVYRIGHELALEAAIEAKDFLEQAKKETKKDKQKTHEEKAAHSLLQAITLEAFAAHYSTDAFTSAHMRVPRKELHYAGSRVHSALGDILAHEAHEEDSELWVTSDAHPDGWMACGDNYFFETKDYPEALPKVVEMVEKGISEVITSFIGINSGEEADADEGSSTGQQPQSQADWQTRMWPSPESPSLGRNKHCLYKVNDKGKILERQEDNSYKEFSVAKKGAKELVKEAARILHH